MKGNFHVRFLEGGGLATARFHSVIDPFKPLPLAAVIRLMSPLTR